LGLPYYSNNNIIIIVIIIIIITVIIMNEVCAMWKQNAAQVIPIAISSTGVIPVTTTESKET